ncbi:putative metal-nicotianamine transporter YSL7 [Dichanthelium oligosanthes]|uniref:Putative metal-nicotianamine transporter YSL7 n=1 Tax=Dichanthelium oligosanthes TaxID=888268 RepID=A0A1E5VIF9_9POAL|nr:putative metal-nicotianamine transporter YSL7 [Dichanthelium oligosanthes]
MGKQAAGWDKDKKNIVEPSIARLITFLFLVSFSGLFILMPLRKWFFTASRACGFRDFPMFGLEAYKRGFYFDFCMTNVAIGMLCPYMITASLFIGSAISWGIISPYLATKAGIWYPAEHSTASAGCMRSYKVFIGVSMILADGLFNFLSILSYTLCTMYRRRMQPMQGGSDDDSDTQLPFHCLNAVEQQKAMQSFDDRRRVQVFLRDHIPNSVSILCYILLSVVSTIAIPYLYPQMRPHHVAFIYLAAPVFAFCDAYGFGVTDMNLSSTYGKLAMLLVGSVVGRNNGGVIAGLVSCGIVMGTMSNSNNLMQELRTGYLTLTSPRAVFISQAIGTGLGCVINPVMFWALYKLQDGDTDVFDVPYARVYRGIAMLSTDQDGLPMHGLWLCRLFFALALALSVFRDVASRKRWWVEQYMPSTICVAIAFVVPVRIPIDMFVGSLVLFLWRCADSGKARAFSAVVASGLICGDGLGMLLSSVMSLTNARAPICIKFLSRSDNVKLDAFLATLPMS